MQAALWNQATVSVWTKISTLKNIWFCHWSAYRSVCSRSALYRLPSLPTIWRRAQFKLHVACMWCLCSFGSVDDVWGSVWPLCGLPPHSLCPQGRPSCATVTELDYSVTGRHVNNRLSDHNWFRFLDDGSSLGSNIFVFVVDRVDVLEISLVQS